MTQPNPQSSNASDNQSEDGAKKASETPTQPPTSQKASTANNRPMSATDQLSQTQPKKPQLSVPMTGQPTSSQPEAETRIPQKPQEESGEGADDAARATRPLASNGATTNKLPTETVIALENSGLIYGHATDVGLHREKNEDSLLAYGFSISSMDEFSDFGVFIIADGMGGHADGDRASATAVRSIGTGITRKLYFNLLRGTSLVQLPPVNELLVEEVENANGEIRSITSDGGTTCTAALVIGRRVFIAHTGDSRAYHIKMDGIERITRDHSLAERLRETGVMTEEEAAMHPKGNQLYSALGMSDDPRIDSWTRVLSKGSRLLLCSDGLWNMVPDGQIFSIMMQHPVPQDACNQLVAAANQNGGLDNISAIVLHIP